MVHVRELLDPSGLFGSEGNQLRPITRADIEEVLNELDAFATNGSDPNPIMFDRLSLENADLRGLDLSEYKHLRFTFRRCNLRNVLASPHVEVHGQTLDFHDLAYLDLVGLWATGQTKQLAEFGATVRPTILDRARFDDAEMELASFTYARLAGSHLAGVVAERSVFDGCDLRGADLRFARLSNVNLAGSNVSDANFYGAELENCSLEDVQWGRRHMVIQEKRGEWEHAHVVYRTLTAIHEAAGLYDAAGEFRYRRERVRTNRWRDQALGKTDSATRSGFRGWISIATRSRRRALGQWLLRTFVDWLFGFGERPFRVVWALAGVVLGFALFYFIPTTWDFSGAGFVELLRRFGDALYFSAVSTTALGYGPWADPDDSLGWRVYLGVAQSFLGIFLNALFLVTFVRRLVR